MNQKEIMICGDPDEGYKMRALGWCRNREEERRRGWRSWLGRRRRKNGE
jgi:hypothetical protein